MIPPRTYPLNTSFDGESVEIHGPNRVSEMAPQELEESRKQYRLRKQAREAQEQKRLELYRQNQDISSNGTANGSCE